MRSAAAASLSIMLAGLAVGCGSGGADKAKAKDTHDAVLADMVAVHNDYADALATVKDESSYRFAEARLNDGAERIAAVNDRMKKLGDPTPAEDQVLTARWTAPLFTAKGRVDGEFARILSDPQLGGVVKEAIQRMKAAPRP